MKKTFYITLVASTLLSFNSYSKELSNEEKSICNFKSPDCVKVCELKQTDKFDNLNSEHVASLLECSADYKKSPKQ